VNKLKISYLPADKGFLLEAIDFLLPYTASVDKNMKVELADGVLHVTFGSKLTTTQTRFIHLYVNNLLNISLDDLKHKVQELEKMISEQLKKEVKIEVDFASIAKESKANQLRLAHWLVDIGVGSMLDECGIALLPDKPLVYVREHITKFYFTYDLNGQDTDVKMEEEVITLKYGLGRSVTNHRKNMAKHLLKVLKV